MTAQRVVMVPAGRVVHLSSCADVLVITKEQLAHAMALEALVTARSLDDEVPGNRPARDAAMGDLCRALSALGLTASFVSDVLVPRIDELGVYR